MANSLGELLGLGATFAIGAAFFSAVSEEQSALLSAGVMTATGVIEGTIVGWAQGSVLRRAIAGISRRAWVMATVVGAVIAWFLGSLPMLLISFSNGDSSRAIEEPPQAIGLLLAAGLGLVAGLILSAAQWLVLRRYVAKAWWWLPANAVAWAAGMPLLFAGIDLAQTQGSIVGGVIVMAVCIAITGAVVGAIHGVILIALATRYWSRQ
ncbi:MAG: hypothetical protein IGS50_09600 [Synechococcales cyanobacterium C42_A2020_086]|nr:hypothetical protein [Synechococcales cyanobacterium C42_A2020_086]